MTVPRYWRENKSRYNLIGSYCKTTDTYHFPKRAIDPEAGRESLSSMEEYQFKGTGKIIASTTVYQPQTGYEIYGPYSIAIVELDEGARITSHIVDIEPEMVKPGIKVKSVFRKLGEDSKSGIIHYGTKFAPMKIEEKEETEEIESVSGVEL